VRTSVLRNKVALAPEIESRLNVVIASSSCSVCYQEMHKTIGLLLLFGHEIYGYINRGTHVKLNCVELGI
jgi:D-arabinose 1-dehydrogenase-like Zn-dependent alcohol dehydrogenase